MASILILHPDGDIKTNPNLHGLALLLAEDNYTVTVASLRRQGLEQESPGSGITLRLIEVDEAQAGKSLLPDELKQSPPQTAEYIRKEYGDVDLVIGVDQGILDATLIARSLEIPAGFISYHRETAEQTDADGSSAAFAFTQNEKSAKLLSDACGIDPSLIFHIPYAGRGEGNRTEKRHVFSDAYEVPEETRVALMMGDIRTLHAGVEKLMDTGMPGGWALAVHHIYGRNALEQLQQDLPAITGIKQLLLSPFETLAPDEMGKLLSEVDLGIASVQPGLENPGSKEELQPAGCSNGAVAVFLQYGLPVIVGKDNLYADAVRKYDFGAVVETPAAIPPLLQTVTQEQLANWSGNASWYFKKYLDLDTTARSLLQKINALTGRGEPVEQTQEPAEENRSVSFADAITEAERLMEAREFNHAEALLLKLVEESPRSKDARNNLAVVYIMKKQYQEAMDIIVKILEEYPRDITAKSNKELLDSLLRLKK